MPEPLEFEELTKRNIKAIYEDEKAAQLSTPFSLRLAHKIAKFSGTVTFVVIQVLIFTTWISINVFTPWKFDPYPFILLTLAVSLEAIFLSTFILISQNALANQADRCNKLDLQINILAEEETTAMLRLLNKMAARMGIPLKERLEVKALSSFTNPEEMLHQLSEIEDEEHPKPGSSRIK